MTIKDLDWEIAQKFVGGRGYAAKILNEWLSPHLDPLNTNNIKIFSTGPLTGTTAPTSGCFSISSKSPLTNTIFDANCGGTFGPELKRSGFDLIIINGRSREPVYLWIHNGKA